ncbi:hypothetical protein [Gaiella sp.]|uniref:hypothetical protein n=1 Tax=Gaiella sp. TaxID=2663207 RepID=UPI003266A00D
MTIHEFERTACRIPGPIAADRHASTPLSSERRLHVVAPLIVDDGCDVRLRGGRHSDVVRLALLEWSPLRRDDLLVVERGDHRDAPGALATLVRPPTIWSTAEALLARENVGRERGAGRARHEALVEYAFTRLEEEHLERLRGVTARIAQRQLPFQGLLRASDTVARGCMAVASDDGSCAAVAATLLARYAASAFVTQTRREAAPTMT